jgi:hypothetical protein
MNQELAHKPGSTETGPSRVRKSPLHIAREPIDLAEWPVVTLAHAPIRDRVVIENILGADSDGNGVPQGWELALRNAALGAPIAGDQDIYVAIMALLHETDFRERVLRITRADLCRVLEWRPSDKKYLRIQDSLSRFRNVTYTGKNIFKDPKTGERFGYIEFGFVDSFAFSDRPPKRAKGADQPELPLSYVRLADEFLILCRHAHLKLINLDFYRSLSRPETRWLYRFLDKNLYKRNEYRIGLSKLRRKQGLLATLDPKYIKRDHKPRLDELKAKGFLRDFRFEKGSDRDDPWQIWVLKDPAFGVRRAARRLSGMEPPEDTKPAPESPSARNSAVQESGSIGSTGELVGYFHQSFHGTARATASKSEIAKAAELLSRCTGDVVKAKHCIDWTRNEAGRTNFAIQHFSALLLNGYPERALANLDAERETVAAARTRQEQDERQETYNAWFRQELDRRLNAIDPVERERLISEALVELRAGRPGITFSSFPEQTQRRIAESKLRRGVGRGLPSFDEWAAGHTLSHSAAA